MHPPLLICICISRFHNSLSNPNLKTKFFVGDFPSLLQMYIDLTGPTVTAVPVKYDPHKKIVPLLAALYHTWVLIKRYFVDFQISWYLRSSFTLENGEGGHQEQWIDGSTSLPHKGSSTMEQIFSVLHFFCAAYLSHIMSYITCFFSALNFLTWLVLSITFIALFLLLIFWCCLVWEFQWLTFVTEKSREEKCQTRRKYFKVNFPLRKASKCEKLAVATYTNISVISDLQT